MVAVSFYSFLVYSNSCGGHLLQLQCCTYIKILDQRAGQVYFPLCILFRINDGPLWRSIACVSSVQCGYGQHSFCEEIAGARESQGYM